MVNTATRRCMYRIRSNLLSDIQLKEAFMFLLYVVASVNIAATARRFLLFSSIGKIISYLIFLPKTCSRTT